MKSQSRRLPDKLVNDWRSTLRDFITQQLNVKQFHLMKHLGLERDKIRELWLIFSQDRQDLAKGLLNSPRLVSLYLTAFHLPNLARGFFYFQRFKSRYSGGSFRKLFNRARIIDIGCGTGAMAQALTHHLIQDGFQPEELYVNLIDQSRNLTKTASTIVERTAGERAAVRVVRQTIERIDPARLIGNSSLESQQEINIVSLGYVWNELDFNPRAQDTLKKIFSLLLERNSLITITEPAKQKHSRQAMFLRGALIDQGFQVLYPCTQQGSCPLLSLKRDWCFSEFHWKRPAEQEIIDRAIGLKRNRLQASVFFLASPQLAQSLGKNSARNSSVIVGRPQVGSSGRMIQYLLCSKAGLTRVDCRDEFPAERGEIYASSNNIVSGSAPRKSRRSLDAELVHSSR